MSMTRRRHLARLVTRKNLFLNYVSIAGNVDTTIYNLDKNFDYELVSILVDLTTDATGANRYVRLVKYDDLGTYNFTKRSGLVSTAGATWYHQFAFGLDGVTAGTTYRCEAMPAEFTLTFGESIKIAIDAGVAGDAYMVYFVFKRLYKLPEERM